MTPPQKAVDNFGQKWTTFEGKGYPCVICGKEMNDGGWREDLHYAAYSCFEHVFVNDGRFYFKPDALE